MNKIIIIPNTKYSEIVSIDEILFCKALGSYSEIFLTENRKIVVSRNLHWFEQQLISENFCRPHKSFLVNTLYIQKIFKLDKILSLKNGTQIPVSRYKKKEIWRQVRY